MEISYDQAPIVDGNGVNVEEVKKYTGVFDKYI